MTGLWGEFDGRTLHVDYRSAYPKNVSLWVEYSRYFESKVGEDRYRCKLCHTQVLGHFQMEKHTCPNGVHPYRQMVTEDEMRGNREMGYPGYGQPGNVAICEMCGNVFKSDTMGHVLFRFNGNKQAMEKLLCPQDTEALYDWFNDNAPSTITFSEPFDPEEREQRRKAEAEERKALEASKSQS